MTKKLLLLLTLITISVYARAQQGRIENVTVCQSDSKLIISYTLNLERSSKMKDVRAFITIDGKQIPLDYVSGDVGTVKSSGHKVIEVDIFRQFENQDIVGDISVQVKGHGTYISPVLTIEYTYSPSAPYGFTAAYCGKWVGGYMNLRGGTERTDYIIGPVVRLHKLVYLYAGIGYSNSYASQDRRDGMACEVGARVVLSKLVSISGGYNAILSIAKPPFSEFHLGVGFTF